jgi:hypothetical protein
MSTIQSLPPLDVVPPVHRNLDPNKPLDKSLFRKDIQVIGARIRANQTNDFLRSRELAGYEFESLVHY